MIRTAGISAALAGVLDSDGAKAVRERLDIAKSTFGDWGTDIRNWPGDKLLEAASAFPAVGAAVLDSLTGSAPTGRASDAGRDGFGVMVTGNKALAAVATSLADGTYSPAEARTDLPALREHLAQVRRLILDVEAVAAVGGQIGGRS